MAPALRCDADSLAQQSFASIYSTDLVYVSDCWKLCGDAHCCSFARIKSKFRLMARTPFQELPLLPGEYEYLRANGWLAQFGDHDHKVIEYPLSDFVLRIESIISRRPQCACDHDTRPTICRLYPLMPTFDIDGHCLGTELLGIYEELETLAGLAPACQLHAIPFEQMSKFLTITTALGRVPIFLYYLEAYRLTKAHVRDRVAAAWTPDRDVFSVFEGQFLRNKLIDHAVLRPQLEALLADFRQRYGQQFASS